jgi:hypothetical protein
VSTVLPVRSTALTPLRPEYFILLECGISGAFATAHKIDLKPRNDKLDKCTEALMACILMSCKLQLR